VATVLDAYALIALVRGEPAADEVELILRRGGAAVSSVNFGEAVDVLHRRFGIPERELQLALGTLVSAGLDVVSTTERHAWRTAEIRARHYSRRGSELSLADCFAIAVTGEHDEIATSDLPLARAARAEGLAVVALPDSRGRRP